jgi:hypothetical protein
MSRPLAIFATCIALLVVAACSTEPPLPTGADMSQELTDYRELQTWLALQRDVQAMGAEQAQSELGRISAPKTADELFYFALLNQRVEAYGNWTLARDKFRELRTAPGLTDQQRQLASILEQYNQNRINWFKSRELVEDEKRSLEGENQALRDELASAESERLLLEEKIRALTDLETSISTRREQ